MNAKLRNYGSAREMALFNDNIPLSVYDSLIDAVHDKIGYLHKYMKIRSRELGLKKLDMYDMYNPLLPGCKKEYSFFKVLQNKKVLFPTNENRTTLCEKDILLDKNIKL